MVCALAGFGAFGVGAIGSLQTRRLPWLAAGFVVAAIGLGLLKVKGGDLGINRVEYDDEGVFRTMGDGREETVRWDQLVEIEIVTTDRGPFVDDVFWLLIGEDGTGCAVPSETEGMKPLLKRLQQLPGFDNDAVIAAMTSTSNARFHVWKRIV